MMNLMKLAMVGLALAFPVGCDKGHDHDGHDHGDHKHGDGHDHGDHKHGEGEEEALPLGTVKIGEIDVEVVQRGHLHVGKDNAYDIKPKGEVKAIRIWVGSEEAKGSPKALAEKVKTYYHTHADNPDPLPAGAKLWVEIEMPDGKKHAGAFDLKR